MFLCLATLPYVMDLLPKPDSSLWESHLETFVEKSNQNNFDEAYEAWHSANETFFSLQCHYFQRITLSPGLWNKLTAGRHLWSLRKSFKQALNRPQIKEAFAHNGLHASLLTPSMRYTTKQILRRAHHKKSLHELEQYQQYDFNTYTTLNANSIEQQLRVYSANVLFFPYPLSYFFWRSFPLARAHLLDCCNDS